MDRTLTNIRKIYQQYSLVFVAVIFALFTSCTVKSSINNLTGIPVNTEQGLAKKSNAFGSGSEKCMIGETIDTKIYQTTPFQPNDLLPIAILAATFLCLLGYPFWKEQAHPLYGNLKISGTLPLFLQHQKFII